MGMNKEELYAKYERFSNQKKIDSDLLVRWCTKAGCTTYMKAENREVKYVTCPTCSTQVCFNCRDTWHGDDVSCKDGMRG